MNQDSSSLISILRRAIKAVPAVKYALSVGGFTAVIAIFQAFNVGFESGILVCGVVLALMALLIIFANLAANDKGSFHFPALVLTWVSLISVMVGAPALFFSVFNGLPLDLKSVFLGKEAAPPVADFPLPGKHMPANTSTPASSPETSTYATIKVFYATDRKASGSLEPALFYSGERSNFDTLSLGTVNVSIPEDHRVGEIERPTWWRLEFHEDPEKHVVLLSVTPDSDDEFYSSLSGTIAKSTNREAFVFIHGYDVSFADAARRTAQLAYDLVFDGAPILYSWPSKGELKDYPADEASVEWSTPHLKGFLESIATISHAHTVHLIAHSMGNRALTASLNEISKEHSGLPAMFKQVLLAAPDVDVGVFKHLAQNFPAVAERVTLYASSKDDALIASKKFHAYPRAGESRTISALAPRVDTIDATAVDTQFLGHSYYGDNRSILSDIFYVIRDGKPPSQRFGMRPNNPTTPTYWIFRP